MASETWFAGAGDDRSLGLDADYSFVVRRWTREPEKRQWGDIDYGESEPVAICFSVETRDRIIADHQRVKELEEAPIPMVLHCPLCYVPHVDEDMWSVRPHRTHLCGSCGETWRPANVPTVGVASLPSPEAQP